jgi:methylglutaconyl-CoA hydratase
MKPVFQTIRFEIEPPLAIITLNRPEKRNALNPQLIAELGQAFAVAESEAGCRVVLLKAEGKAFSAGLDLESLQEISKQSYEENLADARRLADLFRLITTLPKPVIAVVEGPAIAGGCGLATVCDLTLATPEAKFGYTEVKIGFVAAIVGVFLARMLGEKHARELLLSGRMIDAAEAFQMGLVNEVVPAERILDRTKQLAGAWAGNSPQSIAATKKFLGTIAGRELDGALAEACEVNAAARQSEDCKEGVKAFLEKRTPRWQKGQS